MTELSPENIFHLSHLARLDLSEEERVRYAKQLSSVVGYIEKLSEVATDRVSELRGVTGQLNVMAADDSRLEKDALEVEREDLLRGAPVHDGEFYVVRAVLSDENAETA